ncbi:MAG TPA: response regulator transcription factor [Kineosporiaceae bacterium]
MITTGSGPDDRTVIVTADDRPDVTVIRQPRSSVRPTSRDISVLLVDDEAIVRAGLAMLIDAEPGLRVVGEAADGAQAVRLATELRPDVVVMDVRMPGTNGVEATRRLVSDPFITGSSVTTAVLVLTTFNDDEAGYDALRAGAAGFLLKSAAPRFLPEAICSVAAGDAWLDPAVARRLLADFAARPGLSVPAPVELERLTVRERGVLVLVAHGLTNAEIAAHLVVSEATVKTHLGRVLVKLGVRGRAQAVAMAYRTGLVRPEDRLPAGR